jgi:uncharacterized membrane protein YidH (DUF202 family)
MKDPHHSNKIEKWEANKRKEIEKIEKEVARKEMDKTRREYNNEKSRIVLERLQLSWLKWNITCIALGFTVYKIYEARVHEGLNLKRYYVTGREMGIFLISLGFISLLSATLQHRKNIAYLKSRYENMHYSLALRVSYVVMVFSIIVFQLVIFRI